MRGTQSLQPALYLKTWFVFRVNPDNQIEFVTLVFFFDLDTYNFQVCKFRVGSFNYPMNKMVFYNELIPADTIIKSILDYKYVYA